jgi:hypothetical protein
LYWLRSTTSGRFRPLSAYIRNECITVCNDDSVFTNSGLDEFQDGLVVERLLAVESERQKQRNRTSSAALHHSGCAFQPWSQCGTSQTAALVAVADEFERVTLGVWIVSRAGCKSLQAGYHRIASRFCSLVLFQNRSPQPIFHRGGRSCFLVVFQDRIANVDAFATDTHPPGTLRRI